MYSSHELGKKYILLTVKCVNYSFKTHCSMQRSLCMIYNRLDHKGIFFQGYKLQKEASVVL